jgi:hypothetical protein
MKKLIIVLNEVAGTGKSVCARGIHELVQGREFRSTLVQTDPNDRRIKGAHYLDLSERPHLSEMIEVMDSCDAAVLDLKSGAVENFSDFFFSSELDEVLTEMGVQITFVTPVVDDVRSLVGVRAVAETFGDVADFVVVTTPIGYDEFEQWKTSAAKKAMDHLDAIEVAMPEIEESMLEEIESRGLRLSSAIEDRWNLPRFLLNELQSWLLGFHSELEVAEEFVVPDRTELEKNGNFKSSYDSVALRS